MLFMSILTFEPRKRSEVIKRRTEKAPMTEGRVIGEWSSTIGVRIFRVVEVDDPKAMLGAVTAWSDLGRVELIPVMTSEEAIKIASSKK